MFIDACEALAEVSRELDCDPEQGGAEPILAAIAELKARTPAAPGIEADIPELLAELRDVEDYFKDVDPNPIHLATVQQAIELIDASTKGGSDAVDAELWRFCNGKHQIDDAERIECHVIVGVNVWRGDEWLSFHQGSPEEVRAALQATSAEVGS